MVYRDGVNRPLYDRVLQKELPQILNAIDEVYGKCRPLISFVVVKKRIYERFFCTNEVGPFLQKQFLTYVQLSHIFVVHNFRKVTSLILRPGQWWTIV